MCSWVRVSVFVSHTTKRAVLCADVQRREPLPSIIWLFILVFVSSIWQMCDSCVETQLWRDWIRNALLMCVYVTSYGFNQMWYRLHHTSLFRGGNSYLRGYWEYLLHFVEDLSYIMSTYTLLEILYYILQAAINVIFYIKNGSNDCV